MVVEDLSLALIEGLFFGNYFCVLKNRGVGEGRVRDLTNGCDITTSSSVMTVNEA